MQRFKKINKAQILTVVALAAIFILLFPIPMQHAKEESYLVAKTAQWDATWYIMAINRQWGPSIGTQTFEPTFLYDWGYGVVYGGYNDGAGFTATTSIYVETPGIYSFILGSDDGSRLYVDGNLVIDNWRDQYYSERTVKQHLSSGRHSLSINYYEYLNAAVVYFDVDKGDLFTWEETANRTVTETVYVSILEYLMEGGKP